MSRAIERLTNELGYPLLDAKSVEAFVQAQEDRVVFLTGDPARNLETDDVAAILPELMRAFPGRFTAGVADRTIEQSLRERFDVWPVPSLIFLHSGRLKGAIPKVRDWAEYLSEIQAILEK